MSYSPIGSSTTNTTNTSRSSSPATSTDESSDIDELDHRSRMLTGILKRNANKAEGRKSVLDMVRDKAWLLEDQVKVLEKKAAIVKKSIDRNSCKRRLIVFGALVFSSLLIFFGFHHTNDNKT